MNRPLFFNEDYFHAVTPVDENQNYKLLRPVVWECQELYIQDIIGTPLYNELKDQWENNTMTALNLTLVQNYIAPCLANYVMKEGMTNMLFKMRNKSVMTDRSDFSDPVDFTSYKHLQNTYQERAEKYAGKIEDYLCANSVDYPLYTSYTSVDEVRAQGQRATTSLALGIKPRRTGMGWEYYER
jgi:hypothetical protein